MTESSARDNRCRVSLVTTELSVGGAEQCLVHLATRLDPDRFLPIVYALSPPPSPPRDELIRRLADAKVEVRFLGVRRRTQLWTAVRKLTEFLGEQRPAIVQSFLFHANVVAAWAAQRARVPRLVTGWRVADRRRWRPRLERLLTRRADRVSCVSRWVADQARSAGFPEDKLVVIPNGVEAVRFRETAAIACEQLGAAPGRKLLVAVGRLDAQKGFDWLLEQAPRLLDELPEHDLAIVGEGPERRALETAVAQRNLTGRVHLPGWRADVPAVLSAASLVVIPSRWEGMSNVLLEAMASRRPVVATRAEGVLDVLGPLAEAQSVVWGDQVGFVAKVVAIARDKRLALYLGAENAARVAQSFTLDAMVRAYSTLYDELAERTPS